jgi:hypothetical protein
MGTGIGYAFIGTGAFAFLAIAHMRAMKMKEQSRVVCEMFWYAGGALPVALAGVLLASNGDLPMVAQRFFLGIVGAFFGSALLVGIGEWVRPIEVKAQGSQGSGMSGNNIIQPPVKITGDGNVLSFNQSGGITANTVNIGPQPRTITESQKERICSSLKESEGVSRLRIDLIVIMNPEIQQYAEQIYNVLSSCGFDIKVMNFGSLIPELQGILLYDPRNELSRLRTAFDAAGIRYTRNSNRASDSPYPPTTPALTIGAKS